MSTDSSALSDVELGLLAITRSRGSAPGPTGPCGNPGPVGPTGPIGLPGVSAVCGEIRFSFTINNSSSAAIIPASASVWYASVNISGAYNNGAMLLVGNANSPDVLMKASDSLLGVPAKYEVSVDADWVSAAPVLISVLGAPTMGVGLCVVRYAVSVA